MKAVVGIISLLLALAIVGLISVRQLRAVGHVSATGAASAPPEVAAMPQLSGSGSVRDQARALEKQVGADVAASLGRGAERTQEADKP
ncbi:MAG: hypothetical protein M3O01_16310 [Pseudomonadota bacterium]|nr:hypothetical protein [Pseudomonadota bacterium]